MSDIKYAMLNFTRQVEGKKIQEWVIYDKEFKRLGTRSEQPPGSIAVSPMRVYTETKGKMVL